MPGTDLLTVAVHEPRVTSVHKGTQDGTFLYGAGGWRMPGGSEGGFLAGRCVPPEGGELLNNFLA